MRDFKATLARMHAPTYARMHTRTHARTHTHTRGVVCYKVSLTGHTSGGEGGQVAGQKGEGDVLDDLHSTGGSQRGEYSDSHANGTQVAQPANHVGGKYSG